MLRKAIPLLVGLVVVLTFILLTPRVSSPPISVVLANATTIPTIVPLTPVPSLLKLELATTCKAKDDRSDPIKLLCSYFGALKSEEYLRAYSYWSEGVPTDGLVYPGINRDYVTGRSDFYDIHVGNLWYSTTNGLTYYTVAVLLRYSGPYVREYGGCYQITTQQATKGSTPYNSSLVLTKGNLVNLSYIFDARLRLTKLCDIGDIPTGNALPTKLTASQASIAPEVYLDDHSTPEQVIRSFYNSMNRKEYTRALSYWNSVSASYYLPTSSQLTSQSRVPRYDNITFGNVTTMTNVLGFEYYYVPVILTSTQSNNEYKYVGCYTVFMPGINQQIKNMKERKLQYTPLTILSVRLYRLPLYADSTNWMPFNCRPSE